MAQTEPKAIRHLSDLTPDPNNARLHNPRNLGLIEDALHEVGAARSIVVDEDGVVLAGNGLIEAAAAAGIERVQVVDADGETIIAVRRTGLTDEQKTRLALFDNRSSELSEWNTVVLAGLLEDAPEAVRGLWGEEELTALIEAGGGAPIPATEDLGAQMDRAEELRAKWSTERGQLWEIPSLSVPGKCHRLLCGDSTSAEDVARLMGGERAAGAFTSPAYAEQRKAEYGGIPESEYVEWWCGVQESVRSVLSSAGSFFVNIKPHSLDYERSLYVLDLIAAMKRRWSWLYVDEFCWLHEDLPGAYPNRLRNGFEPVHQFSLAKQIVFHPRNVAHPSRSVPNGSGGMQKTAGGNWTLDAPLVEGMAQPSNVLRIGGNTESVSHAAAFPVGLPEFFLRCFSDDGDIWFEPFSGSGTTLVAAEQTGRLCYGMEIEPKYVAVALERLAGMGLEPRLVDANPQGNVEPAWRP